MIPSHLAISDFVRTAKGCSSRKLQQEFEHISKRYLVRISWLAPDIIAAIMDGAQPPERTGRKLNQQCADPATG